MYNLTEIDYSYLIEAQNTELEEKSIELKKVLIESAELREVTKDLQKKQDYTHRQNVQLKEEMAEYKDFKLNHEERTEKKNQLLYTEIAVCNSQFFNTEYLRFQHEYLNKKLQ